MMVQMVNIKRRFLWKGLLFFTVLLQSCGDGSSGTPATPVIPPKIYLTDTLNDRVVKLDDMSGNYSYWTSKSGFFKPKGIYLDSAGKIYVADTGNNRIVRMDDITGTNWTSFSKSGSTQLTAPSGISVDNSGNIFVSDTGNNQIVKIDTSGNWTPFGTTSGGNGTYQFSTPSGIFVDSAGQIYVTDTGNNRIVRMEDMTGKNWISLPGFSGPSGIYAISSGMNSTVYVTDTGNNRIVQVNWATHSVTGSFGTYGNGVGQFSSPTGIYLDSSEKIYVTDTGNNRIVRIDDMNGTNWYTVGGFGPGVNQFKLPSFAVFQ